MRWFKCTFSLSHCGDSGNLSWKHTGLDDCGKLNTLIFFKK